ncbi:MAG: class I SAM-dependent methyltransferase [Actinobacteria bacterium]|nr:class I SAM-dependent methyltransferase [Actinomycetota bacterium]
MTKKRKIPFIEYYLGIFTSKDDRILDVGCGPARYRNATKFNYIGIDLTKEDYSAGIKRNVDVVASAEDIPFIEKTFDLVFATSTFYQVFNYQKALSEIYRVIKPGGRILLFDYNKQIQKRLEKSENHNLPCWTQFELMNLIKKFGFIDCKMLTRTAHKTFFIEKYFWLFYQSFFSSWIIVTGKKSFKLN